MGYPPGPGYPGAPDFSQHLAQVAAQMRQELRQEMQQDMGRMAAQFRHQTDQQLRRLDKNLGDLAEVARALQVERGSPLDPRVVRIEDIPGRRVPFDLLVEIPIGSNVNSEQQQSVTISQEGPFVAVKRYCTFLSQHQFQVTVGNTPLTFNGRSFGRFRPIHSAWDLGDAHQNAGIDVGSWFTFLTAAGGAVSGGVPAFPSTMSSFRTMEFDGRISVLNQGSSFPRQNGVPVPSTFWTTEINSPQELGALDFFERGESVTFRVQPTHVNNPAFGNVTGANIFPAPMVSPGWPFVDGQYDPHEGIFTPGGFTDGAGTPVSLTTDIVRRLPDGILILGFIGYRIQQAIGPVP
jgi:hypothetical protein